jgi:hypothetical protein
VTPGMCMARFRTWLSVGLVLGLGSMGWPADLPAFPGAEGFGATTPGGRGGKVLFVTHLGDSGPGSLRAACEAEGPRIVVFRTAGLIRLEKPIVVKYPFLTLAGQSAPGDGICLRDYPFQVATHDVVIRFLRSRLGDVVGRPEDCIDVLHGSSKVVVDHCSATWSLDECLSLSGNVSDVTVQWCLIGEALDRSKHPKGAHGYGSLMRANGPISLHHNLWVHNRSRNPRLGDNYNKPPYPSFDFRNNVIYDFGHTCSGLTQGVFPVNYVANTILPGPSSSARTAITVGGPSDLTFFVQGNVMDGRDLPASDTARLFSRMEIDGTRQVRIVDSPFVAPQVKTLPAGEAFDAVLATVGASLPVRDSVDSRIVSEVRTRKGSIIDSQTQVGGWPEYRSGDPAKDSDGDGMPDAWETAHGLNPNDPADAGLDRNGDGYTHVEEYLNSLAETAKPKAS